MLLELTVAEQRFNAVMEVIRDGLTVIEVADRYGVSRQTVHGWLRRYAAGGLEIEVRDRGQGFDAEGVESPTPQKTFEERRRRGWGLHIIKSLMDEVEITSGEWGTRILMRKYK